VGGVVGRNDKGGGQAVEGISPILLLGVLLGYLAVLVCASTSLAALLLLLVRWTKEARIVFAVGLLCLVVATLPVFLGLLEQLARDVRNFDHFGRSVVPLVLLVFGELTLLLAGFGQFIASLRGGRAYAVALVCALGAAALIAAAAGCEERASYHRDVVFEIAGGQSATPLDRLELSLETTGELSLGSIGLLLAVVSLMIARGKPVPFLGWLSPRPPREESASPGHFVSQARAALESRQP
jgi:hypothetical protein